LFQVREKAAGNEEKGNAFFFTVLLCVDASFRSRKMFGGVSP